MTSASANVSESDIRKWFTGIYKYLEDENMINILQDPKRIFNGDETGFSLCPKTKTVLAARGTKDVYEVATGNAKENITVMFTFNAEGDMCPPMIIYNYKRIPQNIIDSVPPNWGIGHSDSGWMKAEVFYEFIANIFYPYILENNIELPVILFVDGHKSHLTYNLSELCTKLKIILIALYPNATRLLQPADVAAFRPLKAGWKKGVSEWRNENPNSMVSRKDFAPLLNKVIKDSIRPDILENGFKACGLYPWDVNSIDFKKCLGKTAIGIELEQENATTITPKNEMDNSAIGLENSYTPKVSKINSISNESDDDHIIVKTLNVSPLESCLVWPNTPERKGNRMTERVPFVVSSKMWKNLYTQKENQKKCIEDEKEMKKKIRIEKKINKIIPTKKPNNTKTRANIVRNLFTDISTKDKPREIVCDKPKSPVFIENQIDEDTIMIEENDSQGSSKLYIGLCVSCNEHIDNNNFGYECNFCSDQYHQKCLNNNSYIDNDLGNIILFICEQCEQNITLT